jgi:hypothetical protein
MYISDMSSTKPLTSRGTSFLGRGSSNEANLRSLPKLVRTTGWLAARCVSFLQENLPLIKQGAPYSQLDGVPLSSSTDLTLEFRCSFSSEEAFGMVEVVERFGQVASAPIPASTGELRSFVAMRE